MRYLVFGNLRIKCTVLDKLIKTTVVPIFLIKQCLVIIFVLKELLSFFIIASTKILIKKSNQFDITLTWSEYSIK